LKNASYGQPSHFYLAGYVPEKPEKRGMKTHTVRILGRRWFAFFLPSRKTPKSE